MPVLAHPAGPGRPPRSLPGHARQAAGLKTVRAKHMRRAIGRTFMRGKYGGGGFAGAVQEFVWNYSGIERPRDFGAPEIAARCGQSPAGRRRTAKMAARISRPA